MKEGFIDKRPLTPAAHEEPDDHAALPPPETSESTPRAPVSFPQQGRRGRLPRWLLVTLVGMLMLAVLAGGLGLLIALPKKSANPLPASTFHAASCPFKLAAGVVRGKDVVCGYLTVPEDHSRPRGPTIRLAVAIFKASYSNPAPDPVVDLEGGPGSPSLANLGPVLTPDIMSNFTPGGRDLILLDQRGVGYSQPSLGCQANETLQVCHDRLVRQGINLNDYTTIQNAEDVHDLVRALGYHQVNLWSISYGTRLALTVMRLFPSDVRSVVLDSTSPPQVDIDTGFPAATQRAFDTLFRGCAANPYCNQHYPHLQAVFTRLVSDLNQHPASVQGTDPKTGKPARAVITGDDVINGVRNALYETALIPKLPKLIYQLAHHDYLQVAAELEAANSAPSSDSVGMQQAVQCSESTLTPQAMSAAVQMVEPETRHYFLTALQNIYANCQLWHVQPVGAVQKQPVTSAIPTLILAGEYDPATPPAYGMLAARTLSKSSFFLFPGTGHGVVGRNSCATSMFQVFVEFPNLTPASTCMSGVGEPLFE